MDLNIGPCFKWHPRLEDSISGPVPSLSRTALRDIQSLWLSCACLGVRSPSCLVFCPLVLAPPAAQFCFCPGATACACSCLARVRPCVTAQQPMPSWVWRDARSVKDFDRLGTSKLFTFTFTFTSGSSPVQWSEDTIEADKFLLEISSRISEGLGLDSARPPGLRTQLHVIITTSLCAPVLCVACSCLRGISRRFTPLACGPGSSE